MPVDQTFRRAVETLKQGREVEYGFLGIQPTNLRPDEVLGSGSGSGSGGLRGMRVGQVLPGTPAARYGLKPGDVVTTVDNTPIHDSDGLVLHVGKLPAEAVTRLSVLRGGNRQTVEVTLAKYAVHGKKVVTSPDPAWRGLRVEYPTAVADDEGHSRGGTSFVDDAVVVVEVAEGSPAHGAGLRRGMLITHVDGAAVRTPKEFAAAAGRNRGPVQLRVAGDEKTPVRTVQPRM